MKKFDWIKASEVSISYSFRDDTSFFVCYFQFEWAAANVIFATPCDTIDEQNVENT